MRLLLWLTLLSVPALGPLFAPGYFWGAHDARHSVYFLFEFHRAISEGILYPRWAPDFSFGFGYPFFNIYAPLAFYTGELFLKLGLDFVSATKLVFGLALVASGWAMFAFVRQRLNERAGLVAALVYLYAPYHLLDVYVRANLAETLAFVFLPLCLWAFGEAIERPRGPRLDRGAVAGTALAYAGLMLAHNGIALLFSPLLAAYMVVLVLVKVHRDQPHQRMDALDDSAPAGRARERATRNAQRFVSLLRVSAAPLIGLGLGLGLSAVFWLPALLEFNFIRTDQWLSNYYDYHDHFIYFFQLFSPHWGFGISQPGPDDDLSLQLGVAPVVLALFSVVAPARASRATAVFFQIATLVLVFLMLPASAGAWAVLRLVSFAQFPWRLLTLTTLTMALLAGMALADPANGADLARKPQMGDRGPGGVSLASIRRALPALGGDAPTLLIALLVLAGSYPYARAEIIEPAEGPVSFAGLMKFEHNAGELTGVTAWVQTIPTWGPLAELYLNNQSPDSQVDYANLPEGMAVSARGHSTVHDEVALRSERGGRLIFNRFYYPGWRATLLAPDPVGGGRELPIEPRGELGLMTVEVPAGEHDLLLRFEDTPPRIAGQWMSVVSALGMAVWAAVRVIRRRRGRYGKDQVNL